MKVNMGCGWRNFGEGWLHIDGGDYDHLDYKDISNLSYLHDDSVDLIYASHVVEYFNRCEVLNLLKEWRRVLKKGGTLRLAVPNFEAICKLYISGEFDLKSFLGPLYGQMSMGNEVIYHKTVYDFDSLQETLISCGFSEVKKYDWKKTEHSLFDDHSQAFLPHMDKNNGTLISLNVECKK
jgi:predicted SAM-dependent methyltransferase